MMTEELLNSLTCSVFSYTYVHLKAKRQGFSRSPGVYNRILISDVNVELKVTVVSFVLTAPDMVGSPTCFLTTKTRG